MITVFRWIHPPHAGTSWKQQFARFFGDLKGGRGWEPQGVSEFISTHISSIAVLTIWHFSVLSWDIFRFIYLLFFPLLDMWGFFTNTILQLTSPVCTPQTPKCWTGRFLMNLWAIFCLLVLSSYTANLAAVMVGEKTFEQVSGIHDDKVRLHARAQT